jgi:hypothetical protein
MFRRKAMERKIDSFSGQEPDTMDINSLVQNFRGNQKGREEEEEVEEENDIVMEEEKYRVKTYQFKQTPWPLVRERTIPTDRPPLVDEI